MSLTSSSVRVLPVLSVMVLAFGIRISSRVYFLLLWHISRDKLGRVGNGNLKRGIFQNS